MQKAIIYCRVSSQRQKNEGNGLESQEHNCRKYAEQKGYEVIDVFKDDITGGLEKRPAFGQVLALLAETALPNAPVVVIVDDIKRLARDVTVHWNLRKTVNSLNGVVESPNYRFGETAEDEFIETIIAAHSELERKQNARQVSQKMQARMESGYWTFCWPLGYFSKNEASHGKVGYCYPEQKEILKEALEGFASKRFATHKAMQDFLQSKSYYRFTKGKEVHPQIVTRILNRASFYAGFIEYEWWDISRRKGHHEAIISEDTLNAIEERDNEDAPVPHRKDLHIDFSLRGFAACKSCNKLMTASWSKGRGKHFGYYRCTTAGCSRRNKSLRKEFIEEEFESLLKRMAAKPETINLLEAVFSDIWKAKQSGIEEQNKIHNTKLKEFDDRISNLVEKIEYTKSKSLSAKYEGRIEELEEEKRGYLSQRVVTKHTQKDFGTAYAVVQNFLQNPLALWNSDVFENKRTVLKLAFTSVIPFSKEEGIGTAPFSLLFELCKVAETDKSKMVEMPGVEPGSNV